MAKRQHGGPEVLVVRAPSAACADAVAAVVEGQVRVALAPEDLDLLPDALTAAERGFSVVSARVVEGARRHPALTDGERATLRLVSLGAGNDAIAAELRRSRSSVKRDVRRLSRLLGVEGRPALIGAARSLGF